MNRTKSDGSFFKHKIPNYEYSKQTNEKSNTQIETKMTLKQPPSSCKMKIYMHFMVGDFSDILNSDLVEHQGRPVQACMAVLIDAFESQC